MDPGEGMLPLGNNAPAVRGMRRAPTDAEKEAAVKRLLAQGMPLTSVNIAEEIAVGGGPTVEQAAPLPAAQPPVRGGPAPSPELLARMKAAQDARNAEFMRRIAQERTGMLGAREYK